MKDQKFTPDSWAYREGSTPHFQSLVYSEETGENIAVVYHDENGHTGKLIAAAPKLVSKLTDLIQHLGKDWDGDSMVEECKELLAEAGCPFEYDEEEEEDQPSPIHPIFQNILNQM